MQLDRGIQANTICMMVNFAHTEQTHTGGSACTHMSVFQIPSTKFHPQN